MLITSTPAPIHATGARATLPQFRQLQSDRLHLFALFEHAAARATFSGPANRALLQHVARMSETNREKSAVSIRMQTPKADSRRPALAARLSGYISQMQDHTACVSHVRVGELA